jgi:hypothetical protein
MPEEGAGYKRLVEVGGSSRGSQLKDDYRRFWL